MIFKIFRYIASPFFFLFVTASLIVIPIGILALIMGFFINLGNLLFKGKIDSESVYMMLMIFIVPILCTKHFIETGNIFDDEY